MKKIYEKPELELVTFQTEEDITNTSVKAGAKFGIWLDSDNIDINLG